MSHLFSTRRRFQLFYALQFGGVGLFMPYLALYLHHIGLPGFQIGILLGTMPLVSFLVQPVWGLLSDIYGLRRTALIIGCFGVGLSTLGFAMTANFYWLFLVILLWSVMRGPISPTGTALALEYLENENKKDEFGALRLWGSISFSITSFLVGAFVIDVAIEAIIYLYSFIMLLLTLLTFTLPDAPITQKANWREGATLLKRDPVLGAFLFGALIVGMTLGIVNQYLAVYMEDINATGWIIGIAMGLSALPEIPLMATVPKMLGRWGLNVILIGGVAVLPVRWFLYTFITEPLLVIPTQILHGIGMTALLVVGVIYVDRALSRNWRATGQSLYSASLYGIGPSIGLFAAGALYEGGGIWPVWVFSTVAGLAGLGIITWAVRTPTHQPVCTERSRP